MARILYLDDEGPLVFLAKRMLGFLGHEVSGYTVAADALAAFRADPSQFDLLLTDLSMPGMNGIEFAQEILQIRKDAVVVIATGHAPPKDIETARRIGVRDVIRKPGSLEEMETVVGTFLAGARPA